MAVTNTGSRSGLVTWTVIATVLGVGSLIWAVISYTQANRAQRDLEAVSRQYAQVIDRGGLTGTTVTTLTELRGDQARGFSSTTPLLEVARQQTMNLTSLVGGAGAADDQAATDQARAALEEAKKTAGNEAPVDTSSLVAGIRSLNGYVNTLKANNARLAADLKATQESVVAAQTEKGQVVTASDEKVAAAVQEATESQTNAQQYAKTQDEQLAGAQEQAARITQEGLRSLEEANARIAALQQQLSTANREREEVQGQLRNFRVPTDQILRQADGVITRTAGTDRVFINLGQGDHVAAGLTFEVFDRLGVPRVASEEASADRLLKGKASIEVVRTQPGISECRVVRLSPGAAITEGDPIINVVYDKNVKFNFFVFGKFNLDYKGEATDRDTDILRRLISGWGGNVADQLDARTDFVVLGEEPVVPNFTQDEIAREPEKAFQKEQAEQALETYTELRSRANQLNIPILNQTRFLYMVGYYEEGSR